MKSEARECLGDPIKYYEKKSDGVICTCFKIKDVGMVAIPKQFGDE